MAESNTYLSDNDRSWMKAPHGFQIGGDFKSITNTIKESMSKEALEKDLAGDTQSKTLVTRALAYVNDIFTDVKGEDEQKIAYLQNKFPADTSVGGMDCINPHWQFGLDDDIRHPALRTDRKQSELDSETENPADMDIAHGLGRVYHEMYYLNQKNIYMSFGVPQFYSLNDFFTEAVDSNQLKLQNDGDLNVFKQLSAMVADKALSFNINVSSMRFSLKNGIELVNKLTTRKITKYYGMRPSMPIYYRMVNSVMAIMAANMNLYPDAETYREISELDKTFGDKNMPPFLKYGPDIYAMLDKRRSDATGTKRRTTDNLLELAKKKFPKESSGEQATRLLSAMEVMYADSDALAHNLLRYIAFRLESGASPSESISNQTGQSELASTVNQKASSARDKTFTYKGVFEGSALSKTSEWVTGLLSSMVESTKTEALGILISGNGYLDIPDIWKSSSFSKSVSFDLQLRARAGDKISIFQSIYIPLAMLLAAACPRGIGENAYAQPFLLEAYSAGLYSVPLGIIESLSIKRGQNEFGWTHDDLPTAIDVTVTIKDLTPILFMSLVDAAGAADVKNIMDANTGMLDYLNTLSGLDLSDRTLRFKRLKRLRKTMFLMSRNTLFNPMVYSHNLANSWVGRLKAALDFKPYYTPQN